MQLEINWLLAVVLWTLVQTVYGILCSFYQLVNSDNSLVMIRVCERLCFQCITATDLWGLLQWKEFVSRSVLAHLGSLRLFVIDVFNCLGCFLLFWVFSSLVSCYQSFFCLQAFYLWVSGCLLFFPFELDFTYMWLCNIQRISKNV